MIIFDTMTITVCGVLLLLAVATPFCNVLFRRARKDEADGSEKRPGFSVIISVHNQAMEIERNLPAILQQDYDGPFEVIVVDESSNDETEDVLKRLKAQFSNLYTTFIPDSSHYLSRRKLSLTIGVKAAKYEWLVFTDADCSPDSDHWLSTIASHTYCDIIMGYTRYADDTKDYQRLDYMKSWIRQSRMTDGGQAFAYSGRNLALKRKVFIDNNGFLNNLKYLRGEYDFMVNDYSTADNTSTLSTPSARMTREMPSRQEWTNEKVFNIDTFTHLDRQMAYHLPALIDESLLHLTLAAHLSAMVVSAVFGMYVITIVSTVSLIVNYLMKVSVARRAMKLLDESMSPWKIPLLEMMSIWRNLRLVVKHSKSDKDDFIRK